MPVLVMDPLAAQSMTALDTLSLKSYVLCCAMLIYRFHQFLSRQTHKQV